MIRRLVVRRVLEFLVFRIWPYPFTYRVSGCCGCGRRFADVVTPACKGAPWGEGYCWTCALEDPPLTEYRALRSWFVSIDRGPMEVGHD